MPTNSNVSATVPAEQTESQQINWYVLTTAKFILLSMGSAASAMLASWVAFAVVACVAVVLGAASALVSL